MPATMITAIRRMILQRCRMIRMHSCRSNVGGLRLPSPKKEVNMRIWKWLRELIRRRRRERDLKIFNECYEKYRRRLEAEENEVCKS